MKNKVTKAMSLIQQAINELSDYTTQDIRSQLVRTLNSLSKIKDKRNRRGEKAKEYAEAAKKKQEEWWNMIKENALKFAAKEMNRGDNGVA